MAKKSRARGKGAQKRGAAKQRASRVFDGDDLRETVAKIEACMDDLKTAADDLKAVRKEARARGYSLKVLGRVINDHRATDPARVEEERAIEELYRQALDMTPMEEIMAAGAPAAPTKGK